MAGGAALIGNRRAIAAGAAKRLGNPRSSPGLFDTIVLLLGGFWVLFGLAVLLVGLGGG